MKRFCALMPSPMQFKPYRGCNFALSKASITVRLTKRLAESKNCWTLLLTNFEIIMELPLGVIDFMLNDVILWSRD